MFLVAYAIIKRESMEMQEGKEFSRNRERDGDD